MRPELSVVVATHNRRELLRSCLESLERQWASMDVFEVVVVVDGSTDGTSEMLGELAPPYQLAIVSQPPLGVSAARNAGAARADGDILLFIDDDEEACPTLVAAHLQAHLERNKLAGVGWIERRVPGGADRFARVRAEEGRLDNYGRASRPLTYLDCYGGNCSVSRATFEEVGGFATDLRRANDLEFAYRLHEAGVEFKFLRDAVVAEYRMRSGRQIVVDRELRGRIAVELYRRHPGIIEQDELGGSCTWSRSWLALRMLALALGVRPWTMARVGFVLPRYGWAQAWFRFAWDYAYWSGVKAAADHDLWRSSQQGLLILRYHAFGRDGERPSRYVVSRRRFTGQMRLLKRLGFNVTSLTKYVEYRREHQFPPPNSVVITIDDGYVDADATARPILERFGLTATVFLVTSPNGFATDPALSGRPMLNLANARRLHRTAIDFGAHTRTHADLTTLEPDAVREQVFGSKEDLERALGAPIRTFAYPFGEVSSQVRDIVERAGFWSACGIKPGHNHPATDAFDLRRIEVRGTYTLLRFTATVLLGDTSRFGLHRKPRERRATRRLKAMLPQPAKKILRPIKLRAPRDQRTLRQ
jgi:glycosyltransferase involved in cell wall biosynthesis